MGLFWPGEEPWVAAKAKLGRMIVALKGLRASFKSTRVRCKGMRVSARAMAKKRNRGFVGRSQAACACEVKAGRMLVRIWNLVAGIRKMKVRVAALWKSFCYGKVKRRLQALKKKAIAKKN